MFTLCLWCTAINVVLIILSFLIVGTEKNNSLSWIDTCMKKQTTTTKQQQQCLLITLLDFGLILRPSFVMTLRDDETLGVFLDPGGARVGGLGSGGRVRSTL